MNKPNFAAYKHYQSSLINLYNMWELMPSIAYGHEKPFVVRSRYIPDPGKEQSINLVMGLYKYDNSIMAEIKHIIRL